jgi:hypothetical protein
MAAMVPGPPYAVNPVRPQPVEAHKLLDEIGNMLTEMQRTMLGTGRQLRWRAARSQGGPRMV